MKRKLQLTVLMVAMLALLVGGAVWAAEAGKTADGKCGAWNAAMRGQGVMGRITAIDGERVTIRTELPDWVSSKLAEKGLAAPQQPASVSFKVSTETRLWRNGAEAGLDDFQVGDMIGVRLDGDAASGGAMARRMADEATVQAAADKLRQRREERIATDGRPVMGTITAINGQQLTIRPELPQTLLDRLAEHGKPLPQLPESLGFVVPDDATIVRDGAGASLSDFAVGEQIGAMVKGDLKSGSGQAVKLADIETARAILESRLAELHSKRQSGDFPNSFAPMGSVTDTAPRGEQAAREGQKGEGRGKARGEGQGQGGPGGPGGHAGRPLLGKITGIEGNLITVKPILPEWAKQRMQEEGRELPPLPESISFSVNGETEYILNGERAEKAAFKVGDEIAAMLEGRPRDGNAVARKLADIESAKKALAGGRGKEGHGPGGPGGEPGHGGPRPMFGTITSISANSITIKPELPDFLQEFAPQGQGGAAGPAKGGQRELPPQITVSLSASTKYYQNDTEVQGNPFKAGDKVAIMPEMPEGKPGAGQGKAGGERSRPKEQVGAGGGPGNEGRKLSARAVTDYATAKARFKQRGKEGGKDKSGKGQRQRGGKPGAKGAGKQNALLPAQSA